VSATRFNFHHLNLPFLGLSYKGSHTFILFFSLIRFCAQAPHTVPMPWGHAGTSSNTMRHANRSWDSLVVSHTHLFLFFFTHQASGSVGRPHNPVPTPFTPRRRAGTSSDVTVMPTCQGSLPSRDQSVSQRRCALETPGHPGLLVFQSFGQPCSPSVTRTSQSS
jgi:hypothetical protein